MKRKHKHPMTLLEIMIVIFIIGIISTVIGVNMKGSLEEAKAFKTKEGIKRIKEIFDLQMATGISIDMIIEDPRAVLVDSGLVSNPDDMLKDGWNTPYEVKLNRSGTDVTLHSKAYSAYDKKKSAKRGEKQLRKEEEHSEEE